MPRGTLRRGPKGKFSGFKLAFLESRAAEYETCRMDRKSGSFLDTVTTDFLERFGYGDVHLDPETDPGDPEDNEDDMDRGCATQEAADEKKVIYDKLRVVCVLYVVRITD